MASLPNSAKRAQLCEPAQTESVTDLAYQFMRSTSE
ncbi:hypothetical protein CFBP8129_18200 [Xanthomonas hortorum pv. gardneri]|uniref:Uncharacterized protein n=1 Tax=Xanthomonas hortorum pv. gardneri TaxID=2754056 RepID=A0A6V7CYZ6_9XANT|nr:hypothetical protein CFBP8129_18200 [Xanthomonas hortorum pv. gardneri]CAD0324592.1 hypothetical protein CFBP8129_18200 [Xanthomonas hortorum pv. gardneri]